jgi:hypothetical protein
MRCTLFVAIARDKDFTKIMFPMLKLYTSYGFLELFLNNTPSQGKRSMFYIVPGHFRCFNMEFLVIVYLYTRSETWLHLVRIPQNSFQCELLHKTEKM